MKSEQKIFNEWISKGFEWINYIHVERRIKVRRELKNSFSFRSYLLWYRWNEVKEVFFI